MQKLNDEMHLIAEGTTWAANGFRKIIMIPVLLLIGVMMTLAGLPLVLTGIYEGLIPLGLGLAAFYNLRKHVQVMRQR